MPEKPIMHGRDHRPGGTDPIPGLGGGAAGVSWAYQATPISAVSVPTSTNKVVAPTTAVGFFTNDSSLFAQGTAIVGGTTYYGIKVIGADGLYLTWATLSPFTQITSGVDYQIDIANTSDPSEADLIMGMTRRTALGATEGDQNLNWICLGTQTGTAQTHAMVFQAQNNNSVASYSAFIQVLCVCLDANQSTFVG